MKYFIMFGPPGAGKGTHAAPMVKKYNLKHTPKGTLVKLYLERKKYQVPGKAILKALL